MTQLGVEVTSYLTQKLGNDWNECEDALAFSISRKAFAIADGATEAFGSRYWSRLLVKSWIRHPLTAPSDLLEMIRLLGQRATDRWSRKKLPWYAEEKASAGSFAAFVGVLAECDGDRVRVRVITAGDSCFIHLRKGQIVQSVPLSEPEQFGFRPLLLPSNLAQCTIAEETIRAFEGFAEAGDRFLLLSDAVASWFLAQKRDNAPDVDEFERLLASGLSSDLDIFCDEQRTSERMRNDDIAALYVRFV